MKGRASRVFILTGVCSRRRRRRRPQEDSLRESKSRHTFDAGPKCSPILGSAGSCGSIHSADICVDASLIFEDADGNPKKPHRGPRSFGATLAGAGITHASLRVELKEILRAFGRRGQRWRTGTGLYPRSRPARRNRDVVPARADKRRVESGSDLLLLAASAAGTPSFCCGVTPPRRGRGGTGKSPAGSAAARPR